MVNLNAPIPHRPFPSIPEYTIRECGEKLVQVTGENIREVPQYYAQCIPGSVSTILVRESVADRLRIAAGLVKEAGFGLLLWDGWRPYSVQKRLWNAQWRKLHAEYPEETKEQIDKRTRFFVSEPSMDPLRPFLHSTGGAVDLTLCDPVTGTPVNMGTDFDAFGDAAWTDHFENYEENAEVRDNRRVLYNAMAEAGFVNLPSEWWHYGYGDKFWAYENGVDAIYTGILEVEEGLRFPLH